MRIGDSEEFDSFGDTDPRKMPSYLFHGALSLNYDSAERADTTRQSFSVCPRHWYIDATFRCEACRTEFLFSAKEQRFWYEEREFYIDSQPLRCPECRKQERRMKILKQQYDSLISGAIRDKDVAAKQAVLEILEGLASASYIFSERMTECRRLLLKQIKKQQENQ